MIDNIMIIGHSHIGCLQSAYKFSAQPLSFDARFIQLRESRFHPELVPNEGGQALNENLSSAIRDWQTEFAGDKKEPRIFLCLAGNQHNILGLVNNPEPYDFVLPDLPDLPVSDDAKLVPYRIIRANMTRRLESALGLASRLLEFVSEPMIWIAPPPPIADADYILQNPGAFQETASRCGISPAFMRYKLWHLQTTLTREWCEAHGVGFIPVPEEAMDKDGFLSKKAWTYRDPTHGNGWYGRLLLEKICASSARRTNE